MDKLTRGYARSACANPLEPPKLDRHYMSRPLGFWRRSDGCLNLGAERPISRSRDYLDFVSEAARKVSIASHSSARSPPIRVKIAADFKLSFVTIIGSKQRPRLLRAVPGNTCGRAESLMGALANDV